MMRDRAAILAVAVVLLAQSLSAPAPAAAASDPWSTVRLSDNRLDRLPCVATDSKGFSYVAFGRIGHQPGVWLSTNRSGSWRTERITSGASDLCGGISVDPLRHLHIVFLGDGQLLYTTNRTGAWRKRLVADAAGFSSVVSDARGRVAISYTDPDGISVASNRSGRWRTSRVVRGFSSVMSRLAADGAGHLTLAYGTAAGVQVATDRTGSWQSRMISRLPPSTVDLGLDATGQAHVAFQQKSRVTVLSGSKGTWRTVIRFSTSSEFRSLGVARSGLLDLLLETRTGTILDRTNRSGAWRTLTLARGAAQDAVVSVDQLGRATAGWTTNGSVMVTTNRTGSFRRTRLTATSWDRAIALTTDSAGHRYIVLARSGVGAGILLGTDRSTTWTVGRVAGGNPTSAAIAVDASGHVHIGVASGTADRYVVEEVGSLSATTLPALDRILVLTPDDPTGVRVVATRGSDLVVVRIASSGWVVETVASNLWSCQDASLDFAAVVHVVCQAPAGIVEVTSAAGPWTSELVANRVPGVDLASEAISVSNTGTVSIAFGEFMDDVGLDPGEQKVASDAGGPWATESSGVVALVGPERVDLATDPSGHRHLLTGGSGLLESTDSTGSWVSSPLPLGQSPAIGRLAIDASGTETVVAEIGALSIAGSIENPVDDAGIVILTR